MKMPQENPNFFVFEVEDITSDQIEQTKQFIAFIDKIIAEAVEKAFKEIKKE